MNLKINIAQSPEFLLGFRVARRLAVEAANQAAGAGRQRVAQRGIALTPLVADQKALGEIFDPFRLNLRV